MPTIVKPNTFIGNLAPQLAWLDANFDALFALINGGQDDANIRANAAIQQSKILDLVADLAAAPKLDGTRAFTGQITSRREGPGIRLTGLETNGRDYQIAENGGELIIFRNDGSEATPSWTALYTLKPGGTPTANIDLTPKLYVDNLTKNLQIGEAVFDSSPDFTVGASPDFAAIPGFTAGITLIGNHRVRVSTQLSRISNSDPAAFIAFLTTANGSVLGASQIEFTGTTGNGSHSYFTPVLPAGGYTFQLQWKTNSGNATLQASGNAPARMQLEEMNR
jgi:hypothetical protein